ncbi:MAG: glycerol-3-phosphate dehydrogenase [Spirochaetes bacterium GWF1_51_8]|nr:MAG: glycerol-3-phosphate dehydrogenase [Spirochaetes bacterium GWF1_51_8]
MKISVIGAGGWGTALAIRASVCHEVVLWSFFPDEADSIRAGRENKDYLPGTRIPDNITITSDRTAVKESDMWLFAVPSRFFRSTVKEFTPYASPSRLLVSATKGFEFTTEKRMSQILAEELSGGGSVTVISGPSHAEEVAKSQPTSIVAASADEDCARAVQEAFSDQTFRLYTNDDVIGVEVCGAVKNVIAVAAGVLRGLGFGDNTMAALITRGLAEIRRLGIALGAKESTFAGLAGMGDLVVTCTSKHSRNGRTGELLASGQTMEQITGSMKMVAEGVETVKTVVKFEDELSIPMPISRAVYRMLYEHADPLTELYALMSRPLKSEYI